VAHQIAALVTGETVDRVTFGHGWSRRSRMMR
jgi:hypothetical protein